MSEYCFLNSRMCVCVRVSVCVFDYTNNMVNEHFCLKCRCNQGTKILQIVLCGYMCELT